MRNFQNIDRSWTLFLDRDGVINERIPGDYVKEVGEFVFTKDAEKAISTFARYFSRIVLVTNQQGIGKGAMTEHQLMAIHQHMLAEIERHGGRIDAIYHCPELAEHDPPCRKPNTGMAQQAKAEFPEIDFERALMVGDSESDMEFAQRLGMQHVFIGTHPDYDCFESLFHVALAITSS